MDRKLWRENGEKNFFECVWLDGRKENKWWGVCIFSPGPPKSFLPKMERKLKEKIELFNK